MLPHWSQWGRLSWLKNSLSLPNNSELKTFVTYLQTDSDGDGIGDACDNCVNNSNTDQIDSDMDGIGNLCDTDDDGDDIPDSTDNCPLIVNANQMDSDGDGHGDVCDNCPQIR